MSVQNWQTFLPPTKILNLSGNYSEKLTQFNSHSKSYLIIPLAAVKQVKKIITVDYLIIFLKGILKIENDRTFLCFVAKCNITVTYFLLYFFPAGTQVAFCILQNTEGQGQRVKAQWAVLGAAPPYHQ